MVPERHFIDSAPQQQLSAQIGSGDTSLSVPSFSGWPTAFPFGATLDFGTNSEERILVTAISGNVATIERGQFGSAAIGHPAGATIDMTTMADDYEECNAHQRSSAAHGTSGNVVGDSDVQSLYNKTLVAPVLTGVTAVEDLNATGDVSVSGTMTGTAVHGGTVTASGPVTAGSASVGGDAGVAGNVNVGGNVAATEVTASGTVSGASVAASGGVSGDSVSAVHGVTAETVTATTVTATTLTGKVDAASLISSGLQHGSFNQTITANNAVTGTLNYPTPYSAIPQTFLQIAVGSNYDLLVDIQTRATDHCTYRIFQKDGGNVTTGTNGITVDWFAIGTP